MKVERNNLLFDIFTEDNLIAYSVAGFLLCKSILSESCSVVSNSLQPHGLHSQWNSPGQSTGMGSLSLLQGIFPTQELNPGLPHCRRILYQLSHQGNPRILEWVAYPSLLRRIFLTQESNWGLLYCRILYQLSYQGSPRQFYFFIFP